MFIPLKEHTKGSLAPSKYKNIKEKQKEKVATDII